MRYTPYKRTSEGHVAVKFRDHVSHDYRLRVFLDEKDVSHDCVEAHVDRG